jgi:methionine-gamma-lyase
MTSFETICVSESTKNFSSVPHQLPLYATSSFSFENVQETIDIFNGTKIGHSYSRYGNPTIDTVAAKIAKLEAFDLNNQGFGLLTSSGMAAISIAVTSIVSSGDIILTQNNLYGGTTVLFNQIFSRYGIQTIFEDLTDLNKLRSALTEHKGIKLIYLETPSNPTMSCVDLTGVATIAKEFGILTMADNTFCTPYLQRPLTSGIDIVVHSTTKYLNGHGNSVSGAIVTKDPDLHQKIWSTLKSVGSVCNAWDAWLLNNGLKTLVLRMDKHSSNALALALYLQTHTRVQKVNYCGLPEHKSYEVAKKQMTQFGGMLSFEVAGSIQDTLKVIDRLKVATNAPTLGDIDTLVLHPATTSHLHVDQEVRKSVGITDNLIRLSVGVENTDDLLSDLDQALRI